MVGSAETFQAFGLSWRSAELAIPELPAGPHNTPFEQMAPGELRLTVEGIGRFRVSEQDLRTFLLGSSVGAVLIQRGLLVLHGIPRIKLWHDAAREWRSTC